MHPFIHKIIKSPFKSYVRGISIGFGITLSSNITAGMLNRDPPINIYKYPQTFVTMALSKSVWFGFLWPSIPFVCVYNPKHYFIVGGGAKDLF